MTIDKKFIDKFVYITSKAALASSYLVGKKDKIAADKAAVDSMESTAALSAAILSFFPTKYDDANAALEVM